MPRALLLARHFPPVGGAGVHRTLGSVRHLPEHGYEVTVITGAGTHADRWSPQDPELLARVPPATRVHRLAGAEPADRGRLGARLDRWRQVDVPWVRWWIERTVAAGLELGPGADVIIASGVPYETVEAGARLSAALGIPWVADLEDPWALDEVRVHATARHRRREVRRMGDALASASAVIMAAPEAAARVRRAFPGLPGAVAGIEIGFEPDDGEGVAPEPRGDALRIVHTGSMHTEGGLALRRSRRRRALLGGAVPGLDLLTRSHVVLLEALDRLERARPALRGRVELHLAGTLTEADRRAGAAHPAVRERGTLPQREAIALMRSADLLFLPMHDLPPGERAGIIPYKTFEYLAAERPILAAVPDGDVRDLLAPLAHVALVRPGDAAAMAQALEAAIERGPVPAVAAGISAPPRLERRACAARIAEVLDGVLDASPTGAPRRGRQPSRTTGWAPALRS